MELRRQNKLEIPQTRVPVKKQSTKIISTIIVSVLNFAGSTCWQPPAGLFTTLGLLPVKRSKPEERIKAGSLKRF